MQRLNVLKCVTLTGAISSSLSTRLNDSISADCEINIGDVVRHAEPNFHMVECFNPQTTHCPIFAMCNLKGLLNDALGEFMAVLDRYTLEDLLRRPGGMAPPQFMEAGAGRAAT